ncbi:hypothetical protein K2173_017310 [Erythroxylum novogranatense]|uniref:Transducin/WD40 repeat-like superfamily protein n=1 Tax=Erythroxylum novogranatense TaxID=1862640 RepID=A0AAV8S581_9ROSI|nr:hypothetical protein K2173_017310 [Erythroxylum novogranatense]
MEDEADMYDGLRAHFPLSFGKQSKSQAPLEQIHNATRRTPAAEIHNSERSFPNPNLRPTIGPPRPPLFQSNSGDRVTDDGDARIGPPPPPLVQEEGDGEATVGAPRRPSGDEDDGVMIGPPRPPPAMSDSDDDVEEEEEEEKNRYRIPMSNEIVLKGHTKVVSALAVDHSGSRVLSGSYDYTVRMYDFQGMNSRLQSFRQLEPFEGHQVRNLSWSPTADQFLCVTGSAQAKIYDRDGLTLGEFVKGDMYIRDLKNTKGHISGLTCGEWHPNKKETILTSSEDGSLRIWDVNDFKSQKQVIKPKLARPGRIPVTTCAWDREGKCIIGGIGIWNLKPGWGSRPDMHVEKAHSGDITRLKVSSDSRILLSRSFDGSMKVLIERSSNNYAQTNIAFSPDEQLFFTGTSVERDSKTGGLLCFMIIFATVGDKSQGGTHILYDPTMSERGALVCVARAPRKKSVDDFEIQPVIHNPHALPLFRDQPSHSVSERRFEGSLKSHKPELPITGPGHGGRLGTSNGSLLTQYLLKQGGMIKETWMEEDPREAILKYADAAAKDPKFIAPAYAQTQPEPVFAKSDSENEDQ